MRLLKVAAVILVIYNIGAGYALYRALTWRP